MAPKSTASNPRKNFKDGGSDDDSREAKRQKKSYAEKLEQLNKTEPFPDKSLESLSLIQFLEVCIYWVSRKKVYTHQYTEEEEKMRINDTFRLSVKFADLLSEFDARKDDIEFNWDVTMAQVQQTSEVASTASMLRETMRSKKNKANFVLSQKGFIPQLGPNDQDTPLEDLLKKEIAKEKYHDIEVVKMTKRQVFKAIKYFLDRDESREFMLGPNTSQKVKDYKLLIVSETLHRLACLRIRFLKFSNNDQVNLARNWNKGRKGLGGFRRSIAQKEDAMFQSLKKWYKEAGKDPKKLSWEMPQRLRDTDAELNKSFNERYTSEGGLKEQDNLPDDEPDADEEDEVSAQAHQSGEGSSADSDSNEETFPGEAQAQDSDSPKSDKEPLANMQVSSMTDSQIIRALKWFIKRVDDNLQKNSSGWLEDWKRTSALLAILSHYAEEKAAKLAGAAEEKINSFAQRYKYALLREDGKTVKEWKMSDKQETEILRVDREGTLEDLPVKKIIAVAFDKSRDEHFDNFNKDGIPVPAVMINMKKP